MCARRQGPRAFRLIQHRVSKLKASFYIKFLHAVPEPQEMAMTNPKLEVLTPQELT